MCTAIVISLPCIFEYSEYCQSTCHLCVYKVLYIKSIFILFKKIFEV